VGVTKKHLSVVSAAICIAAVAASAAVASASHRARTYATRWTPPMQTGMFDPFTFNTPQYAKAFAMTKRVGADYAQIIVRWSQVEPGAPPAGSEEDPTSYAFSWDAIDTKVEAVEAAGLTPMLEIGSAPGWAIATGSTPKIDLLQEFAKALALHFDGESGGPAVHIFEVWNEPNLSLDLSPVSAATYRSMVNAVADSVHAVSKANLVVAGQLDPFKNKARNWHSVAPLAYMRALLCVSSGKHPHRTCEAQIHFDVWSHHPYTHGDPFTHARLKDDVSLGDLPKMHALLKTARRLHRIVSAHPPQFWVTEISWDTNPPRKHAAPLQLEARWTAEALYQMWRSGVTLAVWYVLQDQKSPSVYQSGLYFYSSSLAHARAKPMRTAFRFPFVAYLGRGTVSVWGRDATSDKRLVTIERRIGARGRWRTVARIRSNRYGIFRATLPLAATKRYWLRAVASHSGRSLAFSLTRPSPKLHYGPWGS